MNKFYCVFKHLYTTRFKGEDVDIVQLEGIKAKFKGLKGYPSEYVMSGALTEDDMVRFLDKVKPYEIYVDDRIYVGLSDRFMDIYGDIITRI